MEEFAYEHAWTLSGTLRTATPDTIRTALQTLYPLATDDSERYADYTVSSPEAMITLAIRHDDAQISAHALVLRLLEVAPDIVGTLTMTWPYTEVQEAQFPIDLVFHGQRRASLVPYTLVPASKPLWVWNADGTNAPCA